MTNQMTSSFIIPTSALLPATLTNVFNLAKARLSKQMKQRLESVPEHRRTIAEERITRLMQRSFQEGEKLERIEALVALVLDALEMDEYWTVCQHVHEAEKGDVFHFATAPNGQTPASPTRLPTNHCPVKNQDSTSASARRRFCKSSRQVRQ